MIPPLVREICDRAGRRIKLQEGAVPAGSLILLASQQWVTASEGMTLVKVDGWDGDWDWGLVSPSEPTPTPTPTPAPVVSAAQLAADEARAKHLAKRKAEDDFSDAIANRIASGELTHHYSRLDRRGIVVASDGSIVATSEAVSAPMERHKTDGTSWASQWDVPSAVGFYFTTTQP